MLKTFTVETSYISICFHSYLIAQQLPSPPYCMLHLQYVCTCGLLYMLLRSQCMCWVFVLHTCSSCTRVVLPLAAAHRDPDVPKGTIEESGVAYRFLVYKKKPTTQ